MGPFGENIRNFNYIKYNIFLMPKRVLKDTGGHTSVSSNKRQKRAPRKSFKAIDKRLTNLSKKVNGLTSTHTFRRRLMGRVSAAQGKKANNSAFYLSKGFFVEATDQLRFFDPDNPGAPIEDALGVGSTSEHGSVRFKSVTSAITLRNNYFNSCNVRVYLLMAKTSIDVTPTSLMNDTNLTEFTAADHNENASSSDMYYVSDNPYLAKNYKICCMHKEYLCPGEQLTLRTPSKFTSPTKEHYSEGDPNQTARIYNKGDLCWYFEVYGILGHSNDAAAENEHALTEAKVDYQVLTTFKMEYNSGGARLTDFSYHDPANKASFTLGTDAISTEKHTPANVVNTHN